MQDGALTHVFKAHPSSIVSQWDVTAIRDALNRHESGDFGASTRLVYALGRDPRIAAAALQRVNTAIGCTLEVEPAGRAWEGRPFARAIADEAKGLFDDRSTSCPPTIQSNALAWGVMLGFWIGQKCWQTVEYSGVLRMAPAVKPWPLQHVRFDQREGMYRLHTTEGPIWVPPGGDDHWMVYEPNGPESWMGGAVRPLGLVFADRTHGVRDRSRRSEAHGLAGVVGTLPEGMAPGDQRAKDFMLLLQGLQQGKAGLVKPSGFEVEPFNIDGRVASIFDSIIDGASDDIAMVLLGQTGTSRQESGLGQGGNKVHDGVRYDLLEADVRTEWTCFNAQLVEHWTRLNFERGELAPCAKRKVPDPEEDKRLESMAKRMTQFIMTVQGLRGLGFEPDLIALAEMYQVKVPGLAEAVKAGMVKPQAPAPEEES